jgi:hypothetical protein
MRNGLVKFAAALIVTSVVGFASLSRAAWPVNGHRTIQGSACSAPVGSGLNIVIHCPFVSDDADYFGGAVGTLFVDFTLSTARTVSLQSCWMNFTGTAAACSPANATQFAAGAHDVLIPAFKTLSTSFGLWDYFYVAVTATATNATDIRMLGIGAAS